MNDKNQLQRSLYDNVISCIPRVEIVERYSKKMNRYYPFMIIHFNGNRHTKNVFLEDLELMLFENKMGNKKVDTDNINVNFLDDERGI